MEMMTTESMCFIAEEMSSLSAQGIHVEAVCLSGEDEERHDGLVCEEIHRFHFIKMFWGSNVITSEPVV